MLRRILLLYIVYCPTITLAQFSEQQLIINEANVLTSFLHSADIDGDGDADVLYGDQKGLTWIKNDGTGRFTEGALIATDFILTGDIASADLDNDGDIDIISTVYNQKKIAWHENDGLGNFSEEQIIADDVYSLAIHSADLDGDGDMDILEHGKVAWYENDGFGNFSEQKIISSPSDLVDSIYPTDIDGDDDIDIFAISYFNNKLSWYENDGLGNFSKSQLIDTDYGAIAAVHSADLDGDGDSDVLIYAALSQKIVWYENFINYPSIQGTTFWDVNNNGQLDSLEPHLPKINVQIQPAALASYTDAEGVFKFYVSDGRYTLSTNLSDCWQLTTDSVSYTATIDRQGEKDLNFGYQLVSDDAHTQAYIHSGPTRCGSLVPYWLSVENDGCLPSKGQYGLVLSPLVNALHPSVEPDEIRGDTLLWNYETLISGGLTEIQFFLTIAGTDFIGEFIELTGLSYLEDEFSNSHLVSTYDYKAEIRCAYDPNDKLVLPDRSQKYEENYTLFEEDLTYTIRFQNTGNDTAFNVVLKDQLDDKLDWSSFTPITASHPYETTLSKSGLLEFSFKNILLADSTINEPLSHGFVTYQIFPTKGLPEGTTIENTATIFFDINPPIQTNTTTNILVAALPKTTTIAPLTTPAFVKVYPNPFQQFINVEIATLTDSQQLQLVLLDSRGKVVKRQKLTENITKINTRDLASGVYLYQILGSEGLIASGKMVKF